MPAEQKGFLFKFFDKIACAVAGLALILALVFALHRSNAAHLSQLQSDYRSLGERARSTTEREPLPESPVHYVQRLAGTTQVTPPEPVVRDPFDYILPIDYGARRLGTDREYVLEFRQALESVRIESLGEPMSRPPVEIIEYPVGVDHRLVKVRTLKSEGRARLVAMAGGREVVQVLAVERDVDVQAEPPIILTATAERQGIRMQFEPNPENAERDITIQRYEVLRREVTELSQPFRAVAAPTYAELLRTSTPKAQFAGTPPPPPSRTTEAGEEQQERVFTFLDRTVKPDRTYAYALVSVSPSSEPPRSELSGVVQVASLPEIDFKLTGGSPQSVTVEVAVYEGGISYKQEFNVAAGEEIGGVVTRAQKSWSFLTGCYLLDYQPRILVVTNRVVAGVELPPLREVKSRIIYVDRRGNLRERWNDDVAVADLWQNARTIPKEGERAPVPGYYGPGEEDYLRPGVPPGMLPGEYYRR